MTNAPEELPIDDHAPEEIPLDAPNQEAPEEMPVDAAPTVPKGQQAADFLGGVAKDNQAAEADLGNKIIDGIKNTPAAIGNLAVGIGDTFKNLLDTGLDEGSKFLDGVYDRNAQDIAKASGPNATLKDKFLLGSGFLPLTNQYAQVMEQAFPGLANKAALYETEHMSNPDTLSKAVQDAKDGDLKSMIALRTWGRGVKATWDDPNQNTFSKFMTMASKGQQFVTSQMLQGLSALDQIPEDQAQKMLSQDDLHAHDIVDYLWEKNFGVPEGAGPRGARFALGLGADIFADPLSYLAGGAPEIVENGVQFGNRLVTDLRTLSTAERQLARGGMQINKIIMEGGKLVTPGTEEAMSFGEHVKAIDNFMANQGKAFNFDDLKSALTELPTDQYADVSDIVDKAQNAKLPALNGDKFAVRIPFTDIGFDVRYPFQGSMPGNFLLRMKGYAGEAINSTAKFIENEGGVAGKFAVDSAKSLKTLTTNSLRPIFNMARNAYQAGSYQTAQLMNDFADRWYPAIPDPEHLRQVTDLLELEPWGSDHEVLRRFDKEAWHRGEVFTPSAAPPSFDEIDSKIDSINKYLDIIPGAPAENQARLRAEAIADRNELLTQRNKLLADGVKPGEEAVGEYTPIEPSKELQFLRDQRAQAAEMRSTLTPEQNQLADEIQSRYRSMVLEYRARGLPFQELNPFSPQDNAATGYVKHLVSREWIDKFGNEEEAFKKLNQLMASGNLGVVADKGAMGRIERRTIEAVNAEAQAKYGLSVFSEDPIEGFLHRYREMDKVLRMHDLFEDTQPLFKFVGDKDELPGRGYVELDPQDPKWGGVARDSSGKPIIAEKGGKGFFEFRNYLPEKTRFALANGQRVYMPEDIATRLDYLTGTDNVVKTSKIIKAAQAFNSWFTPAALFGSGYVGKNFFSNMVQFYQAKGELNNMVEATGALLGKGDGVHVFGTGANAFQMTTPELLDLAHSNGIVGSSVADMNSATKDVVDNVIENIATSRSARSTTYEKLTTARDFIGLYGMQRRVAEQAENIPRLGYFMQKLHEGYTPEGAAEATKMWFYDFKDVSPGQQVLRSIVPFSTHALKTAETMGSQIANANLNYIALPVNVRNVLDGAFVDDAQVRQAEKSMLPEYAKDQILGPMLPGGRQVMVQFPWAAETLKFLMDPQRNVHPLLQIIGLGASHWGAEEDPGINQERNAMGDAPILKSTIGYALSTVLPPTITRMLQTYAISRPDDQFVQVFGPSFGSDDLVGRFRTDLGFMLKDPLKGDNPGLQRFKNAADFGDFMNKSYGDNWLYNLYFHGASDKIGASQLASQAKDGMYGNYIATYMRQLSGGLTTIQPMDRNFFLKYSAQQKTQNEYKRELQSSIAKSQPMLMDPRSANNPTVRDRLMKDGTEQQKELQSKISALDESMSALKGFYGFMLKDKFEGTGIINALRETLGGNTPPATTEMMKTLGPMMNTKSTKNQLKLELSSAPTAEEDDGS